jgi:ferredoxin
VTRRFIVVGAGAAAAAAALALVQDPSVGVTVLDVGGALPADKEDARARVAGLSPGQWSDQDRAAISGLPVFSSPGGRSTSGGLPEKRSYGSDFPFRDFGQRTGLATDGVVNDALVSGAYGGFTNVWGAQIMPFSRGTLRDWPVSFDDLKPHYEAVLGEVPFAAEEDDLARLFPLIAGGRELPRLSERSTTVLERYSRHRARLNARGVMLGRARLAFQADACVRCGLCMTGCPYALVYSAAHTLDRLRSEGRIRYHSGLLATRITESGGEVTVAALDLATERYEHFTGDRVLVACGAVGSTRLVLGSLGLLDLPVEVRESTQFMLPFVSRRPTQDPRGRDDFTLNQFNMVVDLDGGHDLSQLHFYTYNDAFVDNLPRFLRGGRMETPRRLALERLSVALGYLPSWAAPSFQITARKGDGPESLPDLQLGAGEHSFLRNRFLRRVLRRVASSAPALDLWPVLPAMSVSLPGKSYHWGSTFPHTLDRRSRLSSDLLGRVEPWRRVHLIDAAVFPTVPATTFTLTVMANAHRIAQDLLKEEH